MYITEEYIAKSLEGKFYQLQQLSLGKFAVVDLNEPDEPETVIAVPVTRWTDLELAYLVELKRQGKSHAQCGEALNRPESGVMDKWQRRLEWAHRVSVPRKDGGLWLDDICRVVCSVCGITKLDFVSPRRSHNVVDGRQVFYWLARHYTTFSLPQIGAFAGGRDHSTVIHGINKVTEQMDRYRTKIELCVFDLGLELPKQEAA